MDSILTSIKKLLGIEEEYTQFDTDITIYINSSLMVLNQIGIGPKCGFNIQDKMSTWRDFVGERIDIEAIKSYVYLSVRLIFDPPQNSFLVDAINKQINELLWRLNVQVETPI